MKPDTNLSCKVQGTRIQDTRKVPSYKKTRHKKDPKVQAYNSTQERFNFRRRKLTYTGLQSSVEVKS